MNVLCCRTICTSFVLLQHFADACILSPCIRGCFKTFRTYNLNAKRDKGVFYGIHTGYG